MCWIQLFWLSNLDCRMIKGEHFFQSQGSVVLLPFLKRSSTTGKRKKKKGSRIDEVAVFVPMLQIPMPVDLFHLLRGLVSWELIDILSLLRNWVVSLKEENGVYGWCTLLSLDCVFYILLLSSKLKFIIRSCCCA